MKINYKDLINFFSEVPSKSEISDKLFQLGHEHEIEGDIFDMELTPNRGDCLSLNGIARDLNIFFTKSETSNIYKGEIEELDINFENRSPEDCPQISFMEIEIEDKINDYQPYLHNFFNNLGNNKTNFFTDISNYISYELGQPTHCFDSKSINGRLIFENRRCSSIFKTVLGSEIKLKDMNCVFSLNEEIISLAGVMGGASTSCSSKTRKVLIECAYFNPESIIGKSIKYNLVSDSAYKFERGVDIEFQEHVLRRFIKVVQDHAEIRSIKLNSFSASDERKRFIAINVDKINSILGTQLLEHEYLNYLKGLGFKITNKIEVPSFRSDISNQNDLAEEIARSIGYNNIKSAPINLKKISNQKDTRILQIESLLLKNGFTEVINFPFTQKKIKESISIDNPLDSNRSNLRTSLKDSLIENLLYNERRQKDSIKLYEISDVYSKNPNINYQKKIGIIVSGRRGHNHIDFSKKLDSDYLNKLMNDNLSHPIFSIVEISRKDMDTKRKEKIFYIEACLDEIPSEFFCNIEINENQVNFVQYKPISEFPSSSRDFSFSVTDHSKLDFLFDYFNELKADTLKSIYMFDFYKNHKLNEIKIGYRLTFQSLSKTLSDKEIDQKVDELLKPILKEAGISIPGVWFFNTFSIFQLKSIYNYLNPKT